MDVTRIRVPKQGSDGLQLGSVVVIELRGRVSEMSEAMDEDEGGIVLSVDGEASVRPGGMEDAVSLAMKKMSNAPDSSDLPMAGSQRELHSIL